MEVNVVSEGLAQTVQYMASNGPTRPVQRGRAKTMTKQQYKEQEMNEAAGLPSNLEEASRVMALEQKIGNVDAKLNAIIAAVSPPGMSEMQPALNVQPTPTPAPVYQKTFVNDPPLLTPIPAPQSSLYYNRQGQVVAPPPTPPERPAVEPPVVLHSSTPDGTIAAVESPVPACPHPAQPTAPPTPSPKPQVSQPATFLPNSQLEASQETVPPIPSPVSLGPVGSQGEGADFDQFEIIESGEDTHGSLVDQEEVPPAIDPVEQKRLGRQQILTDQVANWLKGKDCHKFWRQFLAGACNKNLSYNTWPVEFQTVFNERFQAIVSDPLIISSMCGRITRMQMGHLVAPHVAGAFIVVAAGFLSFALMEV